MKNSNTFWIIGIDEAGRGPLAGPVAVGLFAVRNNADTSWLHGIRDSKMLSEKKRVEWFNTIANKAKEMPESVIWSVELGSVSKINSDGISRTIHSCIEKLLHSFEDDSKVLLDGTLKAPLRFTDQITIIKGDAIEPFISAAAIIAKVMRDEYMTNLSKKFVSYDFESNKGYGTKAHRYAIRADGVCDEHRTLFIRKTLEDR